MWLRRMTTRRWMLSVFAIAAVLGTYDWILEARYAFALREHSAYRSLYDEGRVTPLKYFEKSQSLMDAQIALCPSKRTAFVAAHIGRATGVMENELSELTTARGAFTVDKAEAAIYLRNFRTAISLPNP